MPVDSNSAIYRILDASANRVAEGLRTIEEWARLGLDDADLSAELKAIRHQVTTALLVLPRELLLAARDTVGDVGTAIQTPSESVRRTSAHVVAAGIARTGQSLRVLEEYLKIIDPMAAGDIEQARYRFYTASAHLELRMGKEERIQRLDRASLYVLIDAGSSEAEFLTTVQTLAQAGVDVLQLRDRPQSGRVLTDRMLIDRAGAATEMAHRHDTLFIMNDRADLAIAAQCDGVHVGQEELPLEIARQIVGPDRIVGVSTHSIEQAVEAVQGGANYLGCGPVFPSSTKSFTQFAGIEYLEQVSQTLSIPRFAIGGINERNLDQVTEAGFRRIAVTAAVQAEDDPATIVRRIKAKLARSKA